MAEPYHGLIDGQEYNLKVGSSFSQKQNQNFFHTVRYDFKPASVDPRKSSKIAIGGSNDVTVTVPHVQESESTVFKGSKRPCTKECILIIDKSTGEITLERLSSTIQLKKIRSTAPGVSISKATPPPATQNISKVSTKPSVHKQRIGNKNENTVKEKEEIPGNALKDSRKVEQRIIASKPQAHDINLTSSSSQASDSDSSSSASDSDSDQDDQEAAEQAKALDEALMQEPQVAKADINLIDEDLKLSGSSESDSD